MLSRRRRRATEPHTELNVIPLIDVVFFLLVFYVISTSFSRTASVPVDRPVSSHATGAAGAVVLVAIMRDGSVQIGAQTVVAAALVTAVREHLRDQHSNHVVVVADRTLATGRLLAVMDACRSAGASRVEVAAERALP